MEGVDFIEDEANFAFHSRRFDLSMIATNPFCIDNHTFMTLDQVLNVLMLLALTKNLLVPSLQKG